MSFTDFYNPFSGLPDMQLLGPPMQQGYVMPGIQTATPLQQGVQFSDEGSVGGQVSALSPSLPSKTNQGFGEGAPAADTDVSGAGRKKAGDLQKVLQGVKAPAPPQQQSVRSPAAPQMLKQNSQLATLLASMGVTPQQMLRLSQTFGR